VQGGFLEDGKLDFVSGFPEKFKAIRRGNRFNIIEPEVMKNKIENLIKKAKNKLNFI